MNAAEQQQTFYNQFGDRQWDRIPRHDISAMDTKIAFTLYSTLFGSCTTAQQDSVVATREKVLQLSGSGDLHFGCVFVNVLPRDSEEPCIIPLVRTKPTYGEEIFFVEEQPGRVYTGWFDFLENHTLPSSNICYPENGFYESRFNGHVAVKFDYNAGPSMVTAILDTASTVVKTAATGLLTAAVFFPVATPFVLAASAGLGTTVAYSTGRAITQLVDRGAHHESIGLEDHQARGLWISMGADVIGAVMMGGAVALPRLVASGRIATTMAGAVMDVMNWVSIGVNSFGVIVNVAVLIGKLRSGTLQHADVVYFISSCLFIGNIVVNSLIAERVIQTLSNRPNQLCNLFRMVANSCYMGVKTISAAVTWNAVIETICGETVVAFLRYFNMNHTAQTLRTVQGQLRRFKRGMLNVPSLCMDLVRLLSSHLRQVLDEVLEVWKQARAFFLSIDFGGVLDLFMQPSLQAAEIVNGAERVMDEANLYEPEVRSSTREELLRTALGVARNMNRTTEHEYANICQIAMNDIQRRYDRRLVLEGSQTGHPLAEERLQILQEAMEEFREEFETSVQQLDVNLQQLESNGDALQGCRLVPYQLHIEICLKKYLSLSISQNYLSIIKTTFISNSFLHNSILILLELPIS